MKQKQQQFLTLRADGLSLDKIAKEINITKPTLIKWSSLLADELNDLKALSMLALKEEYKYTQKSKYETLLKHLKKIDKAIEDKDLSSVSIKDLMLLKNDILDKLNHTELNTNFKNVGLEDLGIMDTLEISKQQLVNINKTII